MLADIIISIVAVIGISSALFLNENKIGEWQDEVQGKPLSWRDNRD